MNVDWLVTCRYAESDGTVGTIVGAGIDVLFVPQFPSPVGVMLAVRLAAPAEEIEEGQEHELVGFVRKPDGQPTRGPDGSPSPPMSVRFQAAIGGRQFVPGWLVAPMFAFGIRWLAEEEGTYTVGVGVAGADPAMTPVHVLPASRQHGQ